MSGYRGLHRETSPASSEAIPIWHIATSPLLSKASKNTSSSWRIWSACGTGQVRSYVVQEKGLQQDVLDASACSCDLSTIFIGASQTSKEAKATKLDPALSCSQVRVARNYVGDDDNAGDVIVASLSLSGKVRLWSCSETLDDDASTDNKDSNPTFQQAAQEFQVEQATGTMLQVCPPNTSGVGDVVVAVACLDGSVAMVASGMVTPKCTKEPTAAGTILETWSKSSSIALCGDWHPSKKQLAVGRQDGLVEILGGKPHRLVQHEAPVRAITFTPDGHLLISASDDGMLCVWDVTRPIPVLVNHVVQAHGSWILSITPLSDSRRVVTSGADGQIHVWSVGQLDQPLHTFSSDDMAWSIHAMKTTKGPNSLPPRLVSGSEKGTIQIYSLEA